MSVEPGMESGIPHASDRDDTRPRLVAAFDRVDKELAALGEALDVLATRLELVLRPGEPHVAPDPDREKTVLRQSDASERVRGHAAATFRLGQRVAELTNRLDT